MRMVTACQSLAQRLLYVRTAKGMSQEQIAQAVGITQPSYSALERGISKSTSKIGSLAHVLGVDAYWLETGEGHPHRSGMNEARGLARQAHDAHPLLHLLDRMSDHKRKALLDFLQD